MYKNGYFYVRNVKSYFLILFQTWPVCLSIPNSPMTFFIQKEQLTNDLGELKVNKRLLFYRQHFLYHSYNCKYKLPLHLHHKTKRSELSWKISFILFLAGKRKWQVVFSSHLMPKNQLSYRVNSGKMSHYGYNVTGQWKRPISSATAC